MRCGPGFFVYKASVQRLRRKKYFKVAYLIVDEVGFEGAWTSSRGSRWATASLIRGVQFFSERCSLWIVGGVQFRRTTHTRVLMLKLAGEDSRPQSAVRTPPPHPLIPAHWHAIDASAHRCEAPART